MKKILLSFITCVILLLCTGCIEITSVIESIEIDKSTIPSEVTVDDFVLSDIQIIIHRTDNTSYKKSITRSMLSDDALKKLQEPGIHNIYVRYEGKIDLMTVVLLNEYPSVSITFETMGGSTIQDQIIPKKSTAIKPTNPVKEGYIFGGWFTDIELTKEFSFTTKIQESITLYAKWAASNNIVTFNFGEGFAEQKVEVMTDSKVEAPNPPEREGYKFGGWYTDTEFENEYVFNSIVKESFTLYGKWIPNEYTIKFNSNGGTTIDDVVALRDTKIIKPIDPIRIGFMIEGWYIDTELTQKYDFNNLITSSFTLYAKWETAKYDVSFETSGGTIIPSQKIEYNQTVTVVTNPTREDYTFDGWYINKELTTKFDFNSKITSNLIIYAKWTIIKYNVSFNSNGGSVLADCKISSGQPLSKPANPIKSGYIFAGWYIDAGLRTLYDFESLVRKDLVLYARWNVDSGSIVEKKYTIAFDSDGGTDVDNIEVVEGYAATAPKAPTKEGYTFGGWYIDITDEFAFDFATPIIRDYRLVAKWLENHTVKFYDYSGNLIKTQIVGNGLSATAPVTPIKEGYVFRNWNNSFDKVYTDLIVRPIYVIATYNVVFKDYDDRIISEQTVEYGKDAILPANPDSRVDEGYHFIGWDKVTTNVSSNLTITAKYEVNTYTVSFVDYNNVVLKTQTVPHNSKASNIIVDKEYCDLLGWYTTNEFTTIYNFNNLVTSDFTVYGKFDFDSTIAYEEISGVEKTIKIITWNLNNVVDLIIPSDLNGIKVTEIAGLYNTELLETITLSKNLQKIQYSNLLLATNLNKIVVDEDSTTFSSLDGVLYNEAKTELLVYPKHKEDIEFEVPATVSTVSAEIFKDTTKLVRVIFLGNVSTMRANIFNNSKVSIVEMTSNDAVPTTDELTFNNIDSSFKVIVNSEALSSFETAWTSLKVYSQTQISDDFLYTTSLGNVIILGYVGNSINVTIPSTIDSKNVTKIDSFAFYGLTNIRGLIIPSTVTEIADNGLINLNLEYLIVSNDVTISSTYKPIFENVLQNTNVYVTKGMLGATTSFSNLAYVYDQNIISSDFAIVEENGKYGLLQYLGTNASVTIPQEIASKEITFVKANAFRSLKTLKSITFGSGKVLDFEQEFSTDIYIIVKANLLDQYKAIYENTKVYPDTMMIYENTDFIYGVINSKATIIDVLLNDKSITIPNIIEIYTVDSIGRYALHRLTKYTTEIIVASTIKYLDDYSLYCNNDVTCNIRFSGSVPHYVGTSVCKGEDVILVNNEYFNAYTEAFKECSVHYVGSMIAQNSDYRYSIYNNNVGIVKYIGTKENVVIPSVINGMKVVNIYAMAFANNDSIKTVTIPETIEYIGYKAFENCAMLEKVEVNAAKVPSVSVLADNWILFMVPENMLDAYLSDDEWNKYQIYKTGTVINKNSDGLYISALGADGQMQTTIVKYTGTLNDFRVNKEDYYVTKIGAYAYYDSSATIIEFASRVTTFGYKAFPKNATSITINAANATIDKDYVYSNMKLFVPDTNIDWYKEQDCWKNYDIYEDGTIFTTVEDFYISSYSNKVNIIRYLGTDEVVTIPQTLIGNVPVSIGDNAFKDNQYITDIFLCDTIKTIGDYAFYGCLKLKNIGMSTMISDIGTKAFHNTQWYNQSTGEFVMFNYILYKANITNSTVILPANVKVISDYALSGITTLSSLTIPKNVEKIGDYAFSDCTNLTTVVMEEGENTVIPSHAFSGCSRLRAITIPNAITTIEDYAFSDCLTLHTVEFGKNVKEIKDNVFMNCTQLVEITLPEKLESFGSQVFNGCTNLMIVTLSSNNINYTVKDNILYSKDEKIIYRDLAPQTRTTLNILSNVTLIKTGAFVESRFAEIIINSSNIVIEDYAFDKNINLSKIIINTETLPVITVDSFGNYNRYIYVYNNLVESTKENLIYKKYEINPFFSFASTFTNVVLTNKFTLVPSFVLNGDYTISYSSSNESIIKMVDGKLTGIAVGSAEITATINSNPSQSCKITVYVIR